MQSEVPHTLYIHDRKEGEKNGGDNYKYDPDDPAIKKQIEAIRRKKERMEAEGKNVEYTMDELFNR